MSRESGFAKKSHVERNFVDLKSSSSLLFSHQNFIKSIIITVVFAFSRIFLALLLIRECVSQDRPFSLRNNFASVRILRPQQCAWRTVSSGPFLLI